MTSPSPNGAAHNTAEMASRTPRTAAITGWRPYVTSALAVVGLADALYLLTVHWGWWSVACFGVNECDVVNTSAYSELFGIPVALLGVVSYVTLLVTSLLVARGGQAAEVLGYVRFFVAAAGVVFSVYLSYLELFVIHAVCPWCAFSAVLVTLIALISAREIFHSR